MKIAISEQTAKQIDALLSELRETDPTITKSNTIAVNQIVQELVSSATKAQRESLKTRLVSSRSRKSSVVRGIHDELDENDPDQLQAAERFRAELRKLREKKPKKADEMQKQ